MPSAIVLTEPQRPTTITLWGGWEYEVTVDGDSYYIEGPGVSMHASPDTPLYDHIAAKLAALDNS